MKKNISIIKLFGLLLSLLTLSLASCDNDDFVEYTDGGFQKVTDPYLQIKTPVVSFQEGTPEYTTEINVVNGVKSVAKVNVYMVYTDASTGAQSEKVLFTSYNVTDDVIETIEDTFTYEDLKSGIIVNGASLPESDSELAVGSGWVLSFEGVTSQGNTIPLAGNVNVAVLGRFAGLYRVIESAYYRIGENNGDWNGEVRFIGSVDEDTYSYNDYWGLFAWIGKSFNFDVDYSDNTINAPLIADGLFSGNRALNCNEESGIFTNVPCEGSNVVVEDEASGKHRIYLTYGYFTDGSGAREFYEVLEKIVD